MTIDSVNVRHRQNQTEKVVSAYSIPVSENSAHPWEGWLILQSVVHRIIRWKLAPRQSLWRPQGRLVLLQVWLRRLEYGRS